MPTAAVRRYWDWLPDDCPCGRPAEQIHHIIHVNGQRITKDHWLVCKLCAECHRQLHAAGGDGKYEAVTGISTVHLAVLNRHNFEVKP